MASQHGLLKVSHQQTSQFTCSTLPFFTYGLISAARVAVIQICNFVHKREFNLFPLRFHIWRSIRSSYSIYLSPHLPFTRIWWWRRNISIKALFDSRVTVFCVCEWQSPFRLVLIKIILTENCVEVMRNSQTWAHNYNIDRKLVPVIVSIRREYQKTIEDRVSQSFGGI